jgi:hypothetical protein
MKNPFLLLPLCALLSCHKHDPAPVDQLPPATQTGQYTFGCLLNGQPWTPQGFDGTSNYSIDYDPSYAQGTLSIAAYRYTSSDSHSNQTIGLFSDSLKSTGRYKLRAGGHHGAVVDISAGCQYYSNRPPIYCKGTLVVTRLDKQAGIIAGTFEFTLAKAGCDTVKVTNGRFDYKL